MAEGDLAGVEEEGGGEAAVGRVGVKDGDGAPDGGGTCDRARNGG